VLEGRARGGFAEMSGGSVRAVGPPTAWFGYRSIGDRSGSFGGVTAADSVGLLLTPAGRVDPYATYEDIRSYGDVSQVYEGFYVTTRYAIIDELLRDPRMRVGDREHLRHWMPDYLPNDATASFLDSMLQTNGPDHTRMRRLASGAFTARRVAGMRDTIVALSNRLADDLGDADVIDFMDHFAYPLPIQVICSLLGVPVEDQQWFRTQADALTVILEPQMSLEKQPEADAAIQALGEYFADLARKRRDQPTDDLTTALVQASDEEDSLSNQELLANLILLLVAGFETTTNLLGNGLRAILDRPSLAEALRANPELAGRYVEETLRYDSPVQLTSRWSKEPLTVGGVEIKPYEQIMMLLGAGNRDPERFSDPATFDPMREGNQPLSFGGGAHYCMGAPLARLEAQVALPLLLRRFPNMRLAGEPVLRDRLNLRGYATLQIGRT
jgi:cytochrome P450